MMLELTAEEVRVINNLRLLKHQRGHGTLRVEIVAGYESLIKREHSERLEPRRV